MTGKLNVGILCGGRSGEHEISLLSAKSVISAIDRKRFDVTVVGISKDGTWRKMDENNFLINPENPKTIALKNDGPKVYIDPTYAVSSFKTDAGELKFDVIFPVLHGTHGEDGTLQGLLELTGIPYVGANHLGSSVAMDKDIAKRLFNEAKIPTTKHVTALAEMTNESEVISSVEKELTYPVFVKPANLGSSVGISKATNSAELAIAIKDAWSYDSKIIIEQGIKAREIECAILGDADLIASELGEIIPNHEFYSYEAKYLDPNGANLIIGADIPDDVKKEIQDYAKRAFSALGCSGMGRADFFVEEKTGKVFINEINTIPGFTTISMYPKLMEKSGIPYPELISRLIDLALKRQNQVSRLKTDFKA